MVTISRRKSAGGSSSFWQSKQTALIYLFIGAILLLSLNSLSIPQNDVNYLRQDDPRKLEGNGAGIESDVDNAILAAAVASTKVDEQFTTTPSLSTAEDESLEVASAPTSTSTSTSSTTISTSASEHSPTTPTSTTAASTIPIRDLIHKRSLQVKQLILDQFSYNSPPNPRYHSPASSSHKEIATTTMDISCDRDDAFKGIPIDDGKHHAWIPNPPGGYSREVLTKWENAFNEAMKRIRQEASGGEKLREFAEMEVKRLRKMRHSLFCKRE